MHLRNRCIALPELNRALRKKNEKWRHQNLKFEKITLHYDESCLRERDTFILWRVWTLNNRTTSKKKKTIKADHFRFHFDSHFFLLFPFTWSWLLLCVLPSFIIFVITTNGCINWRYMSPRWNKRLESCMY